MWNDTDMTVANEDGDESTVNPGVLATDYNKEEGYFEKAWMSFRPQDEVVVMLKEDTPVAVVGHADGVPRVGEAVFKVNISPMIAGGLLGEASPRYVKIGEMKLNPDTNGPDGLDLKLVQEVVPICDITKTYAEGTTIHYYKEWMIAVGPILYIVCHYATKWAYIGSPVVWMGNNIRFYAALATKENINDAISIGAQHSGLNLEYFAYPDDFWPGFYRQSDTTVYGYTGNLNTLFYTYPLPVTYNMFNSIFTRPHTKAELQAAGMWPA
jgi:hypothetical protein